MKAGACAPILDQGVEALLHYSNEVKGAMTPDEWRGATPVLSCLPLDVFHVKQKQTSPSLKSLVSVASCRIVTVRMLPKWLSSISQRTLILQNIKKHRQNESRLKVRVGGYCLRRACGSLLGAGNSLQLELVEVYADAKIHGAGHGVHRTK